MAPVVRLSSDRSDRSASGAPLPVVVALSLAELLVLTERCGRPRLPLDLDQSATAAVGDRLQERLSGGAASTDHRAQQLIAAEHVRADEHADDLLPRLRELGLVGSGGTPHGDVVAAFAALAAPEALLVLDLAVLRDEGETRLRSYFAVTGSTVTQLSTVSGLTYELAWYDVGALSDALARAATVNGESGAGSGSVSGSDAGGDLEGRVESGALDDLALGRRTVELPYEVLTDGTEAARRGRDDLLAEVLRRAPATVRQNGVELPPATAAQVVGRLATAAGRLRVLVTAAPDDSAAATERRTVGVVTWLRTDDVWREATALTVDGVPTVRLAPVVPADLARAVGPVLAQVVQVRR